MARTKEQQREYNRLKQQEYRDKKRSQNQQTPVSVALDEGQVALTGGEVDTPHVEVKVAETVKPKMSLKDRILGKIQGETQPEPTVKKSVRGKKTANNLITTAMPTVVAAFIATYSRDMVHEPYKACAPSKDEVSAILSPLFDILGREVELTGKASQNTLDLINSLICATMFGLRSYMTYVQIKEMEKVPHASNNTESRNSTPTSIRPAINYNSHAITAEDATTAEDNVTRGNTDYHNGDTEREPDEAAIISDMFKRDIEGRVGLGLLKRRV